MSEVKLHPVNDDIFDKRGPFRRAMKVANMVEATPKLEKDFPGITDRYSNIVAAARSLRRAVAKADVHPFYIEIDDKPKGLATIITNRTVELNFIDSEIDPETIQGHDLAFWVSRGTRPEVKTQVAKLLFEKAQEYPFESQDGVLFAAFRADGTSTYGALEKFLPNVTEICHVHDASQGIESIVDAEATYRIQAT